MHEHEWKPVEGARAMYVCACGATGYRPEYGGDIRAHVKPRKLRVPVTVRETAGRNRTGHYLPPTSVRPDPPWGRRGR